MAINRRIEGGKGSGVYLIQNLNNGKIYVGAATIFRKRRDLHLLKLRRGTHENHHMQRSFTKHGEEYFEFYILERCNAAIVQEREQYYIDSLEPEYNIQKTALISSGFRRRPETCSRISEALTGKVLSEEHRESIRTAKLGSIVTRGRRIRPIKQYTTSGEFMKEYFSIAEAARQTNSPASAISECAAGRSKSSNNFKWGY